MSAGDDDISCFSSNRGDRLTPGQGEGERVGFIFLLAGLTELPRGVAVDDSTLLLLRFVGMTTSGETENRSFLVGVAWNTGNSLLVGVVSTDWDFLFLFTGVNLESVWGDLESVWGALESVWGDLEWV